MFAYRFALHLLSKQQLNIAGPSKLFENIFTILLTTKASTLNKHTLLRFKKTSGVSALSQFPEADSSKKAIFLNINLWLLICSRYITFSTNPVWICCRYTLVGENAAKLRTAYTGGELRERCQGCWQCVYVIAVGPPINFLLHKRGKVGEVLQNSYCACFQKSNEVIKM